MPTDPAGNYTLPPSYFAQPGTTIRTEQHNPVLEDIAQALSQRLMRDGRNGMVGPLDMGTFPIRNVQPGTSATDAATVGQGLPVGSVIDFAGANAPEGWLFCAGQAVSRATFAALFSAIGTTYGAGNGSTTFNVPDARGRVAAGKDNMGGTSANRLSTINGNTLGATGGDQSHTLTIAQMPAHNHNGATGAAGTHNHTISGTANSAGAHTHSGSTNSAGAHEHNLLIGTSPTPAGNTRPQVVEATTGTLSGVIPSAGAHTHTISTNSAGAHTHSLSGSTSTETSHTHGIASQGSGQAHNNVQPTIVFNKIIKAQV